MGIIQKTLQVKLIAALLSTTEKKIVETETILENEFGAIEERSDFFELSQTDYYESEMGVHLRKRFVSLKNLIDPGQLADIKIVTNSIEDKCGVSTGTKIKRTVNIDPGYIELSKLVLASTKNFYHRISIGKGIYAEVTLQYAKNTFGSFEWTYPDYRTEIAINFFNNVRSAYKRQLN